MEENQTTALRRKSKGIPSTHLRNRFPKKKARKADLIERHKHVRMFVHIGKYEKEFWTSLRLTYFFDAEKNQHHFMMKRK